MAKSNIFKTIPLSGGSKEADETGIKAIEENLLRFNSNIAWRLARVLDAYENQNPLFSCQGQAIDGYSALADFEAIAKDAREIMKGMEVDNG